MMFRPYRAGDLAGLALRPEQASEGGDLGPGAETVLLTENFWVALEGGRVIGVGGLIAQWPGYARAVVLMGEPPCGRSARAIARACRAVLAQQDFRRIDATARKDFRAGRRFLRWLGFTRVAMLTAYGADGADYVLYERVKKT